MAKRPGEQSDKTLYREVKPNAGCDIPGRQYAQNDEYSGGYQDVEFEGPFNQLLPQDPEYFEKNNTPGEGRFGSVQFDTSRSEQEVLKGYNVISLEDQHSGGSQNRASTYFSDVHNANRGGDDGKGPVTWPVDRPQSTAPDFGDQLRRNDVEGRTFKKGK